MLIVGTTHVCMSVYKVVREQQSMSQAASSRKILSTSHPVDTMDVAKARDNAGFLSTLSSVAKEYSLLHPGRGQVVTKVAMVDEVDILIFSLFGSVPHGQGRSNRSDIILSVFTEMYFGDRVGGEL